MFFESFLVTVEFVLGNLRLASCLNVAGQKCPGKNPGCKSVQYVYWAKIYSEGTVG